MPITRSSLILALALGAIAAPAASVDTVSEAERLAKATAGLTPGKQTNCIDKSRGTTLKLSAVGTKLLYRANRDRLYVTKTGGGCEKVERGDTLVTTSPVNRICRGDIAQTVERTSQVPSGSCVIGTFTPYTR